MTQAMRREVQSREEAVKFDIPAPTRGWNAQDPIAGMKPGDAYQLDNCIPRPGYVELRRGYLAHVVDFEEPVESLIAYRAGDLEKLHAAAGDSIFDVTESGALGAALHTGLSNARFQSCNIANDAGVFTILVNGEDEPLKFNGSAYSTTSIAGTSGSITLDPETLINVMLHKRRLFLEEKESLRVWYLPANEIAGTANLLDLGPVFSEGGALIGMGSWSPAGGEDTLQSVAVFITDQGQVAVFAGNDPDETDDWFHVGTYAIGKPLGRRAVFKLASDLIIVTYDGAVPLSVISSGDREQQRTRSITSRIQNAFAKAAASGGERFGWEAIIYPTGQLALINVPTAELQRAKQFVQSTQTGAWCQFTGINAICWAYVNNRIYFGSPDGVYRWDTGGSDNGAAIQADCVTSFQPFGTRSLKQFTMLRPILRAQSNVEPFINMLVDYQIKPPSNVPDAEGEGGDGIWGVSEWGEGKWTSSNPLRLDWTGATGVGYVGAAQVRLLSNPALAGAVYPEVRCELIGFDGLYLRGGAFG